MDPIRVGINENVLITKAHVNDKKQLEIELSHADGGNAPVSVFDSMLAAGVQNDGNSSMSLRLLGPLAPKPSDRNGNPRTLESRIQLVTGDITRLRNQLTQILEQFMTSDQINLNEMEVQFAGTGITDSASFEARILDQDVLDKIYANLSNRFCELIAPMVGSHEPVRFKLLRQSKDKHFATIPSRYIADQPFIELMSVPKFQSRVKFSAYEIKEGLDNGDPISVSKAENAETAVEADPMDNPFAPKA